MITKYCLTAAIVLVFACTITNVANAIPVNDVPNLTSITFWERTGGTAPTAYTFGVNSSQLTTRRGDPLTTSNSDFIGVPGREFYDVFYSNDNGSFNLNGEYLTIEGIFDAALPSGGALNLAEIGLNFSGTPTELGNYVASFVALGDNAIPSSVSYAIDGDLLTHTTMGNTIGQSERLRLTLGFLSSSGPTPVPEPASVVMLCSGMVGLAFFRKATRKRI